MNGISEPLLHTHERFEFTAQAAMAVAWPLFGADKERLWAPGWDPCFVWPALAKDQQGMVFKIARGETSAIWVNTLLDDETHRAQYVYVIPDLLVTVICLELAPERQSTRVAVSYERTALCSGANATLEKLAADDRNAGAEWSRQINAYLQSQRL